MEQRQDYHGKAFLSNIGSPKPRKLIDDKDRIVILCISLVAEEGVVSLLNREQVLKWGSVWLRGDGTTKLAGS
jgi:hypothetical protein